MNDPFLQRLKLTAIDGINQGLTGQALIDFVKDNTPPKIDGSIKDQASQVIIGQL